MIAWQLGQTATRPRRGNVEVKFTCMRSSRTAFSVEISSLQYGHFTGVSSLYTASES